MTTGTTPPVEEGVLVREGGYGAHVLAVEPGGSEFIPLDERHGKPAQLFWTWAAPNIGFTNAFIGVLAVLAFGLSFWTAVLAVTLGSLIPAIILGVLSARGPRYGVPQMVLSRLGFGFWGNLLPGGIDWLTGSIGWFAVVNVGCAFALQALVHWPALLCLVLVSAVQITVAVAGYNLVQSFQRYIGPVIAVVSVAGICVLLAKGHPGAAHKTIPGGFSLAFAAAFGNAVGWTPFAADYTRYLKSAASKTAIAWWAGLGSFTVVLALAAGCAAGTVLSASLALGSNPVAALVTELPAWLADITLAATVLGGIAANVLNIYSGSLSFTTLGFRMRWQRAIITAVCGTAGFFLAWYGLHGAAGKLTNFLLIIAYWIVPWLAVYFCDWLLRRRPHESLLFSVRHANWAGPAAMAAGMGISIWLFASQAWYTGIVPSHVPAAGDLTFEAGFVITAAIYLGWHLLAGVRRAAKTPRDTP